jgi:hypothetical protein
MKSYPMKSYNSQKSAGRDYSKTLLEMLPDIIGKKAKTIPEIADEAERAPQTVRMLFDRIEKEGGGKFHIKSWKRGLFGGRITPCYLWGEGEDAVKPAAYTRNQNARRYQKTDKGRAAQKRYKAKHLGFDMVASAISKSPLMMILFGNKNDTTASQNA